jgi:hypothetical protein
MLENAGQPDLAAKTRIDMTKVHDALAVVSDLMARAR